MKHTVTFETQVRSDWVTVEGEALSDWEGVYRVNLRHVWLEGVDIIGVLDDATLGDLESQIEPALHEEHANTDYGLTMGPSAC